MLILTLFISSLLLPLLSSTIKYLHVDKIKNESMNLNLKVIQVTNSTKLKKQNISK